MNTNAIVLCILAAAMGVASRVAATGTQFTGATTEHLHALACEEPAKSDNPLNIKRLYDCATGTFAIPHQIRSGAAQEAARSGSCDVPTGPGWALATRRACADTEIAVTAILLNGRNELESIEFARWVDDTYDHSYRYAANTGLTEVLSR
jgi:hypothetical protein